MIIFFCLFAYNVPLCCIIEQSIKETKSATIFYEHMYDKTKYLLFIILPLRQPVISNK